MSAYLVIFLISAILYGLLREPAPAARVKGMAGRAT
jgi:hypothetical protein